MCEVVVRGGTMWPFNEHMNNHFDNMHIIHASSTHYEEDDFDLCTHNIVHVERES